MADKTGISWTDATWNPVRGCSRVSEGCRNCYAERVAARFCKPGQPYHGFAQIVAPRDLLDAVGGRRNGWTRKVDIVANHLADPLRWKKPRRIFVNSMSDLFHESLTNEQIAAVFGVMAAAPQHTFQVLTKRATRMREWFEWAAGMAEHDGSAWTTCLRETVCLLPEHHERITEDGRARDGVPDREPWPLPNVWLGVSVENQAAADERIPELLRTPAAVRFLSCEPLLGPVDLRMGGASVPEYAPHRPLPSLNWVIGGCESGPGARPCSVEWLRSLRDQCAAAGVPYFLKQAGDWRVPLPERNGIMTAGDGSRAKAGGVIELPYLDGVQHAAFPEVPR